MDQSARVCYLSSFSKILLPSMRIGFVALPTKLHQPILHLKELVSRQNEIFMQLTLAEIISSGYLEQHLRRLRKIIKNRRDFLTRELQTHREIKFTIPKVGLNFWLHTGKLTSHIMQQAACHHILIESEDFYRIDDAISEEPQFIRLGFAKYDERELTLALAKLLSN